MNSEKDWAGYSHCQMPTCFNFTSKKDLSGSWCQDECFIEFESGQRITRKELLEMKVDYDWNLDEFEIKQILEMKIEKSLERLKNE